MGRFSRLSAGTLALRAKDLDLESGCDGSRGTPCGVSPRWSRVIPVNEVNSSLESVANMSIC
jgi:hypothetical protein